MTNFSRRRKYHVVEPYRRKDGKLVKRHIRTMPKRCKPKR